MDNGEKNILNYSDIVDQFLDVYYNGSVSRKRDSKVMPLRYSITMLKKLFYENGLKLDDKNEFVKNCNKIIAVNKNYKRIGELIIKNGYITTKRK